VEEHFNWDKKGDWLIGTYREALTSSTGTMDP